LLIGKGADGLSHLFEAGHELFDEVVGAELGADGIEDFALIGVV